MKKESIVQKFKLMAKELENNRQINLVTCEFKPPATIKKIKEAESKFKLTPAMSDFYSEANGMTIQWERKKQKEVPEGELAIGYINLLPVEKVFGNWEGVIYFDENDDFKALYPLDFFIEEACAALYLDGSDNPQVYYHYLGEYMSPLGVDFEGYLQLLLKSRGFWYWQKAITRDEYVNPNAPTSVEERNFRKIMPQLFPDFNSSNFQRR